MASNWKGYTWTSEHGYTFAQVWNFLEYGNVVDTRVEFSNELLIGLFWEESVFQNWWQKGDNGQDLKQHASGFGQIERTTLGIMNALYAEKRMKYTPELIVSDPLISVNATIDYLRYLRKSFKNSSKIQILHNYGGAGNGGSTDVSKKVGQWLACEDILQGARGEFTGEIVTQALTAAEPNHAALISNVAGSGYSSKLGY
ncbi:MAG TPA: hypothetical protein VGC97_01325 [Pyrinomonadaceae bacterium]|jgi:hypothetical protein